MCISLFNDQLCPYIEEFTTAVIIYIFRKFKFCIFTVRPADIQCENWGPGADLKMQCIPPQLTSFQTEEKKEKKKKQTWQLILLMWNNIQNWQLQHFLHFYLISRIKYCMVAVIHVKF